MSRLHRHFLIPLAWLAILGLAVSVARAQTPSERANRSLAQRLPDTNFSAVPLGEVFGYIRDSTGANLHINWSALEQINVTPETPITLRVTNVSLETLLRLLSSDTSDGLIAWYVEDGVIEITTRELSDRELLTRVYDVRDLILKIPDFAGGSAVGGGAGGGGASRSGGAAAGGAGRTVEASGEELVQLIIDLIEPDIWRENGGPASIRLFRGMLIVRAPRSIHERIGGPLAE